MQFLPPGGEEETGDGGEEEAHFHHRNHDGQDDDDCGWEMEGIINVCEDEPVQWWLKVSS